MSDPRDVAKPGDVVKVRVLEVDAERRRIGLSRKIRKETGEGEAESAPKGEARKGTGKDRKDKPGKGGKEPEGALAKAFRQAKGEPSSQA